MNNFKRPTRIVAFEASLLGAVRQQRAGDAVSALRHLQRAHVLGQRDFGRHLLVHWLMLRIGWQRRDAREIVGQLVRLMLVPLGHLAGRLPEGNPGTADISAFAAQAVSPEIARLLSCDEE